MTTIDILCLILPTCLAASLYLYLRREFDVRADERTWTGSGFDPTQVVPRIRRLRADYVTEARNYSAHPNERRAALAGARLTLAGRSFFRRRTAEDSPPTEPPAGLPEPGHPAGIA
jgi:hypothetical protein